MFFPHALIAEPVALPLLMAAFLAATRKWLPRLIIDLAAICVAACNTTCGILLLHQSWRVPLVEWFGNWHPRGQITLGIDFYIDPAAAGLGLLASVLTLLALIFSWRFLDEAHNYAQPLMLIFLSAMCGFSLTGDLFNMFVFFELMSVAAFALCGLDIREEAPLQGAFNFAVTNTIAAFLILTGIAMLYAVTGALNLAQISAALAGRHDTLVLFACTLLFCGYMTKAAMVPFHFWLADAHAVAPTPVCVLFSGLMVELGLYAVLRLRETVFQETFIQHEAAFRNTMLAIAAITVLVGGLMCYAQHHLKRMLAFSTICHSGLMLAALAIGTPVAISGMMTYLLAHAFIKGALFFVAGILLHRLRSVSEPVLFAEGRQLPSVGTLWFIGSIGLAGAPLLLTGRGETLAEKAGGAVGVHWLPILFLLGGVLTSGAALRAGIHIFLGWGAKPLSDESAQVDKLPETDRAHSRIFPYLYAPPLLCFLLAFGLAIVPRLPPAMAYAASVLCDHTRYVSTVLGIASVSLPPPPADAGNNWLMGCVTLMFSLALAFSSVFRLRLPRPARIGALLESDVRPLRFLHSGHVGDYVAWMTVGAAIVGGGAALLLNTAIGNLCATGCQ